MKKKVSGEINITNPDGRFYGNFYDHSYTLKHVETWNYPYETQVDRSYYSWTKFLYKIM